MMQYVINYLKQLGFWTFILLFTGLAVVFSGLLMSLHSYFLTGDFFTKNLIIIGFITPALGAFIVFFIVALVLKSLKKQNNELVLKAEDEERLQQYLDIVDVMILALDKEGQIMLANQTAYQSLGYRSENEILGKNWLKEFLPHALYDEVQRVFSDLMGGNLEPYRTYENDVRLKDGTIRLFRWDNKYIKDDDGDIIGVLSAGRDITEERQKQHELDEQRDLLRSVIDENPDPVVVKDFDGKFVLVNEACAELYKSQPEEMIGKDDGNYIPDQEQAEFFRRNVQEIMLQGDMRVVYEDSIDVATGKRHHFKSIKKPFKNAKGEAQILVVAHDITTQKETEDKLKLSASVYTNSHDAIMITDSEGVIIDVNKAFCAITGYQKDEVLGGTPRILKSGRNEESFYLGFWNNIITKGYWNGEIWNRKKNGIEYAEQLTVSTVYDDNEKPKYYIGIFADISKLKEQQNRLEHMAHYDMLTGLPNRLLLSDRIEQAMAQVIRREELVALAYIDLDGFKEVNDAYGHEMGDKLLKHLSQLMQHQLREGDTIARLGGDEFVAVLIDIPNKSSVMSFVSRLLESISEPCMIDGNALTVSASIGMSFYPQKETISSDQLIRQADQAMYQAKVSGKNRFHIFDIASDEEYRVHNEEIKQIEQALNENEFVLYYQPKVNIRTGDILGVEALVRWQHPEKGLLSPGQFLPTIEEHSLSLGLDAWVLKEALELLHQWQLKQIEYSISVNVSAGTLQSESFVNDLHTMIRDYDALDPTKLIIEVLETSALQDLDHIANVINECSMFGITFALDDFGTGYSSLTYLKRLPASQLKIDQSFIRDMLDDPNDLSILDGIMGFAFAFGRDVIAEGVETLDQGRLLLQLGCDVIQGYVVARPMPIEEIYQWTTTWSLPDEWKNIASINRNDIPTLFATIEHSIWVKTIRQHILNDDMAPLKQDVTECKFGKWYFSRGKEQYREIENLESIEQLHAALHKKANQLIDLKRTHKSSELKKLLESFEKESLQLYEKLESLYKN